MNEKSIVNNHNQKKIPILYTKKSDCCGCSACYAICPVQAIHMEFDAEGFLYPLIDEHKCIGCYQCLKICAYKKDKKAKLKRGLDE